MHELFQLIQSHPATALFVTMAVTNTLVGAMEEPNEKSGPGYRYLYRLGHALSLNFQYAFTKKFPAYQPPASPAPKA